MLTALTVAAAMLAARDVPPAPAHVVVVLDSSLRMVSGEVVSLSAERAVLRGGKDVVERPIAVVAGSHWGPERDWPGPPPLTGPASEPAPDVSVGLTDLSVLRGEVLPGKGDGLVVLSRRLGRVDVTLESLRWLAAGTASPPEETGTRSSDRVRLANGDTIEGFVESIAPGTEKGGADAAPNPLVVTIERSGSKEKSAVGLDRVAWLTLSGAAVRVPPGAATVWLSGGERTPAEEFSIEARDARIVRAKGVLPVRIDASHVAGALLAPEACVPLAQCGAEGSIEKGPDQPLGTRDLELPGWGKVTWTLPEGSKRIAGWAVLPEECRRFGDCVVTVSVAGTTAEPMTFALNGASPVVAINRELPAQRGPVKVTVEVAEGKNGPVQDRVVLRRMLVGK